MMWAQPHGVFFPLERPQHVAHQADPAAPDGGGLRQEGETAGWPLGALLSGQREVRGRGGQTCREGRLGVCLPLVSHRDWRPLEERPGPFGGSQERGQGRDNCRSMHVVEGTRQQAHDTEAPRVWLLLGAVAFCFHFFK